MIEGTACRLSPLPGSIHSGKYICYTQEEGGQDEFGEVMDLVMGLWMQHAPKCQPGQDIAHVPKVDHSQQEKVEAWLESS